MLNKRIISGALALAMVLGSSAAMPEGYSFIGSVITAEASTFSATSGDFTYEVDTTTNEARITKYSGSNTTLTIPSTIAGYKVTGVGSQTGSMVTRKSITKLVVPEGVTTIYKGAFRQRTTLTSISLPSTLTTIGDEAFSGTGITTITLPNSLVSIGANAFSGCTSLNSLAIPASVTTIGEEAFYGCTNLKAVTIPKTVTSIGADAFGHTDTTSSGIVVGFMLSCYSNTAGSTYAETYLSQNYKLLDSSHMHTWGEWVTTKAATCAEEGSQTRTCSGCNQTQTQTIAKDLTAHKYVVDSVVAATYDAQGYTVYKCTLCGNTYKGDYTPKLTYGSLSNATITGVNDSYVYTGSGISPVVTVTLNGTTLKQGTDFKATYTNNINVGTATITITGMNNYNGSSNYKTYKITAAPISGAAVSGINSSYSYTGSELKPTPTVTLSGKTLTAGTDYTVAYTNNTNAGTATVTITGKGNYTGTVTKTFKITAVSINGAAVSGVNASYAYTGSAIKPTPTVTVSGKKLTANTDYTVAYSNNTNAGTATITITAKGNYTGTVTKTFTITAGTVTRIPGDATGDGKVNIADVIRIQQKLAGWKVTLNESNSDVTGDGKINIADVIRIQQKLAGWKVTLN